MKTMFAPSAEKTLFDIVDLKIYFLGRMLLYLLVLFQAAGFKTGLSNGLVFRTRKPGAAQL